MRSVGRARAAISVVNALPLGIGAAVGVDWSAQATASVRRRPARAGPISTAPTSSATPIVHAAARLAVARFGHGGRPDLALTVRSTIPVARGLKSSSAVASSVALAVGRALGQDPSAVEAARVAAQAGRRAKVSATGAFDDALAGLVTGGVVTDNRHDVELRRFRLERGLCVALWIPGRPHPPSPSVRRRFRRQSGLARTAVDAALAGDWRRAMDVNSALVERAMGYRYERLRASVAAAGALASGVSGLGPTLAAVVPAERLPAVLRALPARTGRRRGLALAAGNLAPRGGGLT